MLILMTQLKSAAKFYSQSLINWRGTYIGKSTKLIAIIIMRNKSKLITMELSINFLNDSSLL